MSADATAPVLTHVRFEWNGNTDDPGKLHTKKRGQGGAAQWSMGWVRGLGIRIGQTVQVMNKGTKGWEGTIISGPQKNINGEDYWTFEVQSLTDSVDPREGDDKVTVTVTNPGPPPAPSNPPL